MDSPSDNVRIGCVWTVINLIVTEETFDARGSSWLHWNSPLVECGTRATVLRELGIFDKLIRMKDNDSSLDVKERAKSALAHLDGLNLWRSVSKPRVCIYMIPMRCFYNPMQNNYISTPAHGIPPYASRFCSPFDNFDWPSETTAELGCILDKYSSSSCMIVSWNRSYTSVQNIQLQPTNLSFPSKI